MAGTVEAVVVLKSSCGAKESALRPLVSADARRDERILLEVRGEYLWAKVSYQ